MSTTKQRWNKFWLVAWLSSFMLLIIFGLATHTVRVNSGCYSFYANHPRVDIGCLDSPTTTTTLRILNVVTVLSGLYFSIGWMAVLLTRDKPAATLRARG